MTSTKQSTSYSIDAALIMICSKGTSDYEHFCCENEGASLFYRYIEIKFSEYINIIKQIRTEELETLLRETTDFIGQKTKLRFVNLITKICKGYLKILKECYNPNPLSALSLLDRMLGEHNSAFRLNRYLNEQLVNYCSYLIKTQDILYRMRDEDVEKGIPDNCWHVPYNIRQYSYSGRFSIPGFPCLYLGEDIATCDAEIGELKMGKSRWCGSFTLKPQKQLGVVDLTFPSKKEIESMCSYDKFCLFLNYPLKILCCTKALHKTDSFAEEYLFSQKLMNVLSEPSNDRNGITRILGIVYNSTKRKEGRNYVLSARPNSTPPAKDERHSKLLCSLLQHHNIEKVR